MTQFILGLICGVYLTGFVGVILLEANAGPVTFGLALLRAVVWPYYIATGRPHGEPVDRID